MTEKHTTGSLLSGVAHSVAPVEALSPQGGRRHYTAPRLLSAEPLEFAATTCPATNPQGPGKGGLPFCIAQGS